MKKLNHGILLSGIVLALGLAPALCQVETPTATATATATPTAFAKKDTYGAIAYHPATNHWAYSTQKATKEEATADAVRKCGHSDAKTNWCRNSWIALAISNQSKGGWGSAWGAEPKIARKKATDECLARNPDAHIVLCVSSDGDIETVTKSH